MSNLAGQWRRKSHAVRVTEAELVTLPSGAQVKLRRPSPEVFLMRDETSSQSILTKLRHLGNDPSTFVDAMEESEVLFLMSFVKRVVIESVVEPRLVDTVINPDEEIALTEIPDADYQFIFNWATGKINATPEANGHPQAHQQKPAKSTRKKDGH